MSFYGDVRNSGRTQFYFDRIYPNRKAMDDSAETDGIFPGRFVLVEYQQEMNENFFPQRYMFNGVAYENVTKILAKNTKDKSGERVEVISTPIEESIQNTEKYKNGKIIAILPGHNITFNEKAKGFYGRFTDTSGSFVRISDSEYNDYIERQVSGRKFQDPGVFIVDNTVYVENSYFIGACFYVPPNRNYATNSEKEFRILKITEEEVDNTLWRSDQETPNEPRKVTVKSFTWEILSITDSDFARNWNIDKAAYRQERRTYDSTVWQKVYEGKKEKYIHIADLNAYSPALEMSPTAPTVTPVPPHFGPNSNSTNFELNLPGSWGFRVRSARGDIKTPIIRRGGKIDEYLPKVKATEFDGINYPSDFSMKWKGSFYDLEKDKGTTKFFSERSERWNGKFNNISSEIESAIYVNKNGFDAEVISKSSDVSNEDSPFYRKGVTGVTDYVGISPTGYSGREYFDSENRLSYRPQPDIQELVFMLPSIGDSISNIWDIVYGGRETDSRIRETGKRNLDIFWEYANSAIKREGLRAITEDGGKIDSQQLNTLAGCINSVHDLMGMIIYDIKNGEAPNYNQLESGIIYHHENQFKRKAIDYTYERIPEEYERIYLSRETYIKNDFYTKEGSVYSICSDEEFSENKEYYVKKYASNQRYTQVTNLIARPNKDLFIKLDSNGGRRPSYKFIRDLTDDVDYYFFVSGAEQKITDKYVRNLFFYRDSVGRSLRLDKESQATPGREYFRVTPGEKVNLGLEKKENYNHETNKYVYYREQMANGEVVVKEKPLTYIYCPDVFYRIENLADGKKKLIKETRNYNDLRLKNLTETADDYYIVSGRVTTGNGEGTWVEDGEGNWTTSDGTKNLIVENLFKVKLLPFREDFYYTVETRESAESFLGGNLIEYEKESKAQEGTEQKDGPIIEEPPKSYIVTSYSILTLEKLKKIYDMEFTHNESTKILTDIYHFRKEGDSDFERDSTHGKMVATGVFYQANAFYFKTKDGSYILDDNEKMTEGRTYFSNVSFQRENTSKYYFPNKYYIRDSLTGEYYLDKDLLFGQEKTYYLPSGQAYVIEDTSGRFAKYAKWNENISDVPATVTLGTRRENTVLKEMADFARGLNTIHGLILKINNVLELNNFKTRDKNTVQGCINALNDIIDKFDILTPRRFLVVDNYGRVNNADWKTLQKESSLKIKPIGISENDLHKGIIEDCFQKVDSVEEMRGQWITAHMKGDPKDPKIFIHHNFQSVADTTSVSNKNIDNVSSLSNNDKIELYTPIVDKMGHVVGKNLETVTLPYGFKTVGTNGSSPKVTELDVSSSDVIAENTQDKIQFNVGNKWLRTSTNPTEDSVTFAHTLSPISSQANKKFGLESDETISLLDRDNTFEVPVFKFDEAGHIIFAETHTVTIPEVFKDININGNSTDTSDTSPSSGVISADSLTDTLNLAAGNKWIQLSHDAASDTVFFKHYAKRFTEQSASTDLDNASTFSVQELSWDNAGHLIGSTRRTFTMNDGYKSVSISNSGQNSVNFISGSQGVLTANSHVDTLSVDTGNKWISIKPDPDNKKFVVAHAAAGAPSTTKGNSSNVELKFGGKFKTLEVGIDQAGHVSTIEEKYVTIPTPSLTSSGSGNLIAELSLSQKEGVINARKANVGSLSLTGYTPPTAGSKERVSETDSLNSAVNKLSSNILGIEDKIESLNLSPVGGGAKVITQISQNEGAVTAVARDISQAIIGNEASSEAIPSTKAVFDYAIGKNSVFRYSSSGQDGVVEGSEITIAQLIQKVSYLEKRIKALESKGK